MGRLKAMKRYVDAGEECAPHPFRRIILDEKTPSESCGSCVILELNGDFGSISKSGV